MGETERFLRRASEILSQHTPTLDSAELTAFVGKFLNRRDDFLAIANSHGSPLYLIDDAALRAQARRFNAAFASVLTDFRPFYAIKSNNCPEIANILVSEGLGLDVSSGLELQLALDAGADNIIFSGPAKMPDELALAVAHHDKIIVLIDSFVEVERLESAAAHRGVVMRAGVRLTVDNRGLWRKFGIPMENLSKFIDTVASCRHIELQGLQFHTSWNLDPSTPIAVIARLGKAIADLPMHHRSRIKFIDIGGGYWPEAGEWLHSSSTPEGKLKEAIEPSEHPDATHHWIPSTPINAYAAQVASALKQHIFTHITCRILLEPGRWICQDGMHILIAVVDKKGDDLVIADAGTSALGWERLETDYFPVLNLSRPSLDEYPCYILGSLCTPHDVWGYSYFGDGIEPGDVLLIPTQGAYTYSLRQHFIKPLPKTIVI